jgi:hypothetical protein
MARRKTASAKDVNNLLAEIRNQRSNGGFLQYAKRVASDRTHLLHRHLNSYPPLLFEITNRDLEQIKKLCKFPDAVDPAHPWTSWEKIFYAILWKDGKLESIKRIIEGVEAALKNITELPSSAVVYHYFGRHLTNRLKEPLLDQHSVRAYRLIENQDQSRIQEIRYSAIPTAKDAENYRTWFRSILNSEKITTYEDSRVLDSFLFSLGAYAKLNPKSG